MLASGFTGAPVSKFLFFGLIATSLLVTITDSKYLFHIHVLTHLWRYQQLWRLLVWQMCYTNSTSLLFAAMSIYHLRIIERLWGSRKFASFLLSILPPSLLLPPIIIAFVLIPLSFNAVNTLPAGPTPLIFALLAQYHAAIPTVYKYRIGTRSRSASHGASDQNEVPSILLSDKSVHYLLTAQLGLSSLPGSLLAAAVGWGVGVAWRAELGPEGWARWRVPDWLTGRKKQDGEGFDGLRRRLEGESQGSAVENEAMEGARRRTLGRGILDQFRGAF